MAVMRVEKTTNYTVMANYHLRDSRLTLKAKGLLSVMLSLPAEWDFTLNGLARISKEGVSAIRAAILELEECGYVIRARVRNDVGQLTDTEYTIYEFPQNENNTDGNPIPCSPAPSNTAVPVYPAAITPMCDFPTLENPTLENPTLDNPTLENPTLENRTQLNTKEIKKDKSNTELSNPYQSSIHQSIPKRKESAAHEIREKPVEQASPTPSEPVSDESVLPLQHNRFEELTEQKMYLSEPSVIPELRRKLSFPEIIQKVKRQIDYWDLIDGNNNDEIDNILSIMVEVLSTKCEHFTISGKKNPAELVHQRYSQINYHTILYVLECLHKNGSDIRNIKQYLIATLFNAPATCTSYYGAAVRRDFESFRLQ